MSLTEIPAKMIEKTESFNEARLNTAIELTKLFYRSPETHATKEGILHTFFDYYSQVKEISPPPLDKITSKNKSLLLAGSILIVVVGLILYYIFFIHLGFSLKGLPLKLN